MMTADWKTLAKDERVSFDEDLLDSKYVVEKPLSDKFHLLILDTTQRCNLRCEYCSVAATTQGPVMTPEIALQAFRQFISLPNCGPNVTVEFSGGEPLPP